MATEADLEKAIDQSVAQTKALGEIQQNKPT